MGKKTPRRRRSFTAEFKAEIVDACRAVFYTHRQHVPSRRAVSNAELTERIIAILAESRGTYGAPRIHAHLRDDEGRPLRPQTGGPPDGPCWPGRPLPAPEDVEIS